MSFVILVNDDIHGVWSEQHREDAMNRAKELMAHNRVRLQEWRGAVHMDIPVDE